MSTSTNPNNKPIKSNLQQSRSSQGSRNNNTPSYYNDKKFQANHNHSPLARNYSNPNMNHNQNNNINPNIPTKTHQHTKQPPEQLILNAPEEAYIDSKVGIPLQATIEFSLELHLLYNIDLFDKGNYHVRVSVIESNDVDADSQPFCGSFSPNDPVSSGGTGNGNGNGNGGSNSGSNNNGQNGSKGDSSSVGTSQSWTGSWGRVGILFFFGESSFKKRKKNHYL